VAKAGCPTATPLAPQTLQSTGVRREPNSEIGQPLSTGGGRSLQEWSATRRDAGGAEEAIAMSPLELAIRAGGIALLLAAAAALGLRPERTATRGLLALVCLGVAAFMAGSAPGFVRMAGPFAAALVHGVCNATAVLVWLLAQSWFRRGFAPNRRHVAACVAYAGAMVAADYGRSGMGPLGATPDLSVTLYLAGRALGAVAVLAAVWDTLAGRRDDLLEPRRRARLLFAGALAAYVALLALAEIVFAGRGAPRAWAAAGNGVLALGAALLVIALMVDRTRAALIESWDATPAPGPARDLRLEALARQAELAMERDRLYRRDDLSIAVLAQVLGCPEYRLRRAINGCLGHRNFSDFVHTWRLREAAARLQSRAFDDQSIQDVALEVGFASIGPFNRAFKARFGTTPSEFRARGAAPGA
jgi:AraC-like DNA-binding protein